MSNRANEISFQILQIGLLWIAAGKEGSQMADEDRIMLLEEENRKLKEDNDRLMDVVVQMRVTLNRLVLRYISEENG